MIKRIKRKLGRGIGAVGVISGGASVLSSYNVCHSLCMAFVALLSMFGVASSATFLLFLQPYALLLWNIGLIFLIISMLLYIKFGQCISWRLIMFNSGLIIVSFPFFQNIFYVFWIAGFMISLYATVSYFKRRRRK